MAGDKPSSPGRRLARVARQCTEAVIIACMLLLFFLVRGPSQPALSVGLSRSVLDSVAGPVAPAGPTQVHNKQLGIHRVVLAGYHGSTPLVINIWLRVLCAKGFTLVRGFATAEEAIGQSPVLQGRTLLPNAVLMELPQLYLRLSDGSRVALATHEPLQPNRSWPRDTWHLQASYSNEHVAELIGVKSWTQTAQLPPQPHCKVAPPAHQQLQEDWLGEGTIWGVTALAPVPAETCAMSTNDTLTSSQPSLAQAVLATLSSLQEAGAAGLLLLTPNPNHLQQLLSIGSDSEGVRRLDQLRVWLWDGPVNLQHSGYATNHALNAALLAAWGSRARLLMLESPGDLLRLVPGQTLVNLTAEGGCLYAEHGQVHLRRCGQQNAAGLCLEVTTAAAHSSADSPPTATASADSALSNSTNTSATDLSSWQLLDMVAATMSPSVTRVTVASPEWPAGATLLDPNLATCWDSGDAAVVPPDLANQLLLPKVVRLLADPAGSNTTMLDLLWHTRAGNASLPHPQHVATAAVHCAAVVRFKGTSHAAPCTPTTTNTTTTATIAASTIPRTTSSSGGTDGVSAPPELLLGAKSIPLATKDSKLHQPTHKREPMDAKKRSPKVALLFMSSGDVVQEAVWRAWFEAAARLTLTSQPPTPKAPATYRDALGPERDLFPALGSWDLENYPWWQVQQGLLPTSWKEEKDPEAPTRPEAAEGEITPAAAYQESGLAPGWEPQRMNLGGWEFWPVLHEQKQILIERAAAGDVIRVQHAAVRSTTSGSTAAAEGPGKRLLGSEDAAVVTAAGVTEPGAGATAGGQSVTNGAAPAAAVAAPKVDAATAPPSAPAPTDDARVASGELSSQKPHSVQHPTHPTPADPPAELLPAVEHPAYFMQDLFSVYVHTPAGLMLPSGSIFSGRQLAYPVNTTAGYANWPLMAAVRRLLQVALEDQDNVKFAMVSDTSIPLYHPKVVWAQLMADDRSFVSACDHKGFNPDTYRYPLDLHSEHYRFPDHWRKTSTWAVFNRPHADLVVKDNHVMELFQRYCTTFWRNQTDQALCVSDEHAIPSLLAAYGLANQTNCGWDAHYVHWVGGWHPQSFNHSWQVGVQQLHHWRSDPSDTKLRPWTNCNYKAAQPSANKLFMPQDPPFGHNPAAAAAASWLLGPQQGLTGTSGAAQSGLDSWSLTSNPSRRSLQSSSSESAGDPPKGDHSHQEEPQGVAISKWVLQQGYQPMDSQCAVFARKYTAEVANATLALALSCEGLGLGYWCDGQ